MALLAEEKSTFWVVALVIGIFVGPAQSASRTLMARLAPADQRTEMFGIYALTGKVTAFIGPFLFGTATAWFQSQRAGMATILVMFVVGGASAAAGARARAGLERRLHASVPATASGSRCAAGPASLRTA